MARIFADLPAICMSKPIAKVDAGYGKLESDTPGKAGGLKTVNRSKRVGKPSATYRWLQLEHV
jgi:hypothetical protein